MTVTSSVGHTLQGLEKELESSSTGQFSHGDSPTIADCCLVPQVSNSICTCGSAEMIFVGKPLTSGRL